ncbi:MAG: hypothetical protein HYV95_13560 [Opitutae bacterium]|nr:hypothetical protein [Opitutae bacterium]
MNTRPSTSDSDSFRVVDLFSPSDDAVRPAQDAHRPFPAERPVSADMPASFVFTNPLFARPAHDQRNGERV